MPENERPDYDFTREQRSRERQSDNNNLRLAIQIVISIFIMIGAWFAVDVRNGQKEIAAHSNQQFAELKEQITKLDKAAAVEGANRFTANDWMKVNEGIQVRFTQQERRIDKHDDILDQINTSLKELKGTLQR